MVFFTQITMEAAEDEAFLDAMRKANIKGALVGVEAVTPEGLKDIYKSFNDVGEALVRAAAHVPRARRPRPRLVHLRTAERPGRDLRRDGGRRRARRPRLRAVRDADAVSGHRRFRRRGRRRSGQTPQRVGGNPDHAPLADPAGAAAEGVRAASGDDARTRSGRERRPCGTSSTACPKIWARSRCTPTLRSRLAFVLISKLYRQMYANTGIATDSARVNRANRWARLIARPCRRLFVARPLPALAQRA